MILALAVVVGLIISLARHRRHFLDRVAAIHLDSTWLALLALVMQWPLLNSPMGPTERFGVRHILFMLSHLLLLLFVWRNRRHVGILVVGLGVILNLTVILINGGYMPITPETLIQINPGSSLDQWSAHLHYGYSKDVILPKGATRLWILSDILVLPPPFPWPAAFSLGDLFIAAGIIVFLQGPNAWYRQVIGDPAPLWSRWIPGEWFPYGDLVFRQDKGGKHQ